MDKTKEVTVAGRTYQLKLMTPFVANRVHQWLVSASVKFSKSEEQVEPLSSPTAVSPLTPEEITQRTEMGVVSTWMIAPSQLSEEAIEKIQRHAISCCEQKDAVGALQPVILQDGRWADKNLESDASAVGELIMESLKFSIAPFFIKGLTPPVQTPQI